MYPGPGPSEPCQTSASPADRPALIQANCADLPCVGTPDRARGNTQLLDRLDRPRHGNHLLENQSRLDPPTQLLIRLVRRLGLAVTAARLRIGLRTGLGAPGHQEDWERSPRHQQRR